MKQTENLLAESVRRFNNDVVAQVMGRWQASSPSEQKAAIAKVINDRWKAKIDSVFECQLNEAARLTATPADERIFTPSSRSSLLACELPSPQRLHGFSGLPEKRIVLSVQPKVKEEVVLCENEVVRSKCSKRSETMNIDEPSLHFKRRKLEKNTALTTSDNLPSSSSGSLIIGMKVYVDADVLSSDDLRTVEQLLSGEVFGRRSFLEGRIVQIYGQETSTTNKRRESMKRATEIRIRFARGLELTLKWPSEAVDILRDRLLEARAKRAEEYPEHNLDPSDEVPSDFVAPASSLPPDDEEVLPIQSTEVPTSIQDLISDWIGVGEDADDENGSAGLVDSFAAGGSQWLNDFAQDGDEPQLSVAGLQSGSTQLPTAKVLLSSGEVVSREAIEAAESYLSGLSAAGRLPHFRVVSGAGSTATLTATFNNSEEIELHPEEDPTVTLPEPSLLLIGKVPMV